MYSYGPPRMAKQKQDNQPELTYSSYVRTQDVTQKTCRRRWMIGRSGERWSRISVLAARHDDDDDIYILVYPEICFSIAPNNLSSLWTQTRMTLLFSIKLGIFQKVTQGMILPQSWHCPPHFFHISLTIPAGIHYTVVPRLSWRLSLICCPRFYRISRCWVKLCFSWPGGDP